MAGSDTTNEVLGTICYWTQCTDTDDSSKVSETNKIKAAITDSTTDNTVFEAISEYSTSIGDNFRELVLLLGMWAWYHYHWTRR